MRVQSMAYAGVLVSVALMLGGTVGIPTKTTGAAAETTGGILAEKQLVIAMDSDIEPMDPVKTSTMYGPPGMIYETLIQRDLTGAYVSGLAEWWNMNETVPGHPAFEMRLMQGVTFHDGLEFDTYAVKRILNYLADNTSWVQYQFWAVYGSMNKTGWPDAGIWCKDAYNMSLNLTWADASLVFNLSNLYSSMMSPDALESDGLADYGTPGHKVVGTGPFMLQEWVPGDHVTLVKNLNYSWGASWYVNKGPATIDRIIYRVVANDATRYSLFESGVVDVLQQVPPYKAAGYASQYGLTVVEGPGQGVYYVEFNCMKSPWDNATLRMAFGFAINRTMILNTAWDGYGEEGVNYLSPIAPEGRLVPALYNFSYDWAKSRLLFAQAGYLERDADGWLEKSNMSELTLQLWTTNKMEDVVMSELLHEQFEAVGVHVTLTQYDEATLIGRAAAGEQEAILFWFSWPRADILDWRFGSWAMGGSNTAWYSDPVFDGYVYNWTLAETEDEFIDNATAAHIRLLTQAPWAPVLFWHQLDAVHDRVTGWYVHPIGREQPFDILDVDLNVNPTAVAVVTPNPAMAGETVTFDATGSTDDVAIVNWTWTFNDGGMPVILWGEVVTYVFATEFQTVDVTLNASDGDGNWDTDAVALEVLGAIPEFTILVGPAIGMVAIVAFISIGRRRRE